MGKNKLAKFEENLRFENLIQAFFIKEQNKEKEVPDLENFPLKGKWGSDFFKNKKPIVLELGCGKGEYTIGLAQKYPENNYIGVDIKGARLWRGCKTAEEQKMENVAFLRTRIQFLNSFFDKDEVSQIWITFPDPQHQKKRKRLTSPYFLQIYSRLLKKGGFIHLKTDSTSLYKYTLEEVVQPLSHPLHFNTDNLYDSSYKQSEVVGIKTYYEQIWLSKGKKIKYIVFELNHDKIFD